MEHTYEELKKKTVAELREIASGIEHEKVQGYTQMNKDHLLKAVCDALGLDMFEHHVAKDEHKSEIKSKISELKKKRDDAISGKKYSELKRIRRQIHKLRRALRRAAV